MSYYIQRGNNVFLPPGNVPYLWCMKHPKYEGHKTKRDGCPTCQDLYALRHAIVGGRMGISYERD